MCSMNKRRPNILFLMCDEHRADVSGFEGNKIIKTPNLDRIAKQGVVFRNAYTPSPVCVPSRQSMMSGQLPKTCKCQCYGEDLKPGYMTFAKRFSQYAYRTVCAGKLHHMGTDQMQGWRQRICGDDIHVHREYVENRVIEEFYKLPGFYGKKWSDAKEVKRAGAGKSRINFWDEYTVQGALNFIEDNFVSTYYDKEEPDIPVFLKVSLLQPHYPYTAGEDKFKYYLNRVEPYLDQPVSDHWFLGKKQVVQDVDASKREIRRATAAYYAMVEQADELFGRVLRDLENANQDLNEWIIVYTSDHGEMLGEHGVWEKMKFYEASVRVPLIISWPERFAGGFHVDRNVNLCDLFATLCDLADIPVPNGLDSRSLVPFLAGQDAHWNDESISQFNGENLMIKQGSLKYQYYAKDQSEVLFDLENDPKELINFISDEKYLKDVLYLRKRRKELGFGNNSDPDYVNAGY